MELPVPAVPMVEYPEVEKSKADEVARLKEIFPDLSTKCLKEKLSLGRGFEATVELLLLHSSDREGNERDASVIIISADDESPALKRRKSHEEQGASAMGGSGR